MEVAWISKKMGEGGQKHTKLLWTSYGDGTLASGSSKEDGTGFQCTAPPSIGWLHCPTFGHQ